jgi:hypothetical protein
MPELAVIMDFCSLSQVTDARSTSQKKHKELYTEALAELNTPYGHRAVTSIKLVDVPPGELKQYDDRGWTLFESIMIDSKGGDWNRWTFEGFDLNKTPEDPVSFFLQFPPKTLRPVLTFDDFKRELDVRRTRSEENGLQLFTNSKDGILVEEKYKSSYKRLTEVTILAYDHAGWGDSQVKDLCQALPDFKALEHLQLTGNDIGKAGARALAKVLPNCRKLRFLAVGGNPLCRDRSARMELRKAWEQKDKNREISRPTFGLDADLEDTEFQEALALRTRCRAALLMQEEKPPQAMEDCRRKTVKT